MNTSTVFQTNNFNNTTETLRDSFYTPIQYQDAVSWIQSKAYTNIQKAWGTRWRQCLSNCLPFALKLLQYGYNEFLVQRISSNNIKWIWYDENTALSLLRKNHIAAEVYYTGVAYKNPSRHWITLEPFRNRHTQDNDSKALLAVIRNLIEVGAMAKVSDAMVNSSGDKFSSSYICSKERIREIIDLFITTFVSSLTYTSTYSSYIINTSYNIINSTYRETNYALLGKMSHFDTLLQWNNDRLPDDEQLSFDGRRAYSEVCSYRNEEKHLDVNGKCILPLGTMTIQKYCNKVFGEDNWMEFDRRGSIYNLTRTLNGKGYLENTTDIYELLNGKPFTSKEERKYFKLTQMMVYFSTRQRVRGMLNRVHAAISQNKPTTSKNFEMAEAFYHLLGCPDVDWNTFAAMVSGNILNRQKQMKKIIGDNKAYIDKYGKRTPEADKNPNHIFVHESKAYMIFVSKLRKMNIRVVQVYDGFALPKDCKLTKEQLDKMLADSINEYMNMKGE